MNLPIHLTENDLRRLRKLLREAASDAGRDLENLRRLGQELDRVTVVDDSRIPADLITMNSRVELVNLATGEPCTYTLVFPEYADIDDGRISVLAPLGMAMIGFRAGDEFSWPAPGGTMHFRVGRILGQNVS